MKSLIAVGESKSLTNAGDNKILDYCRGKINPWPLLETKNLWLLRMRNLWTTVGDRKSLATRGDYKFFWQFLWGCENPWRLLWGYRDPSCLEVGVFDKNSVVSNVVYCLSNLLGESKEFWWLLLGITQKGILDLLGNRENSNDFCGELRMRIFILLRSNENSGNFIGEFRMRIFILLENENSVGKKAYCWGLSSGVWVVCHSIGELS